MPAGATVLPDGRVYEAVSPVETEGNRNVYIPQSGIGFLGKFYEHGVASPLPFQAASNGGAVVYPGDPPSTGGTGHFGISGGDEYLATRSPAGGWTDADIQSPEKKTEFQAFSSDLSTGIVSSDHRQPLLSPEAPSKCSMLYKRTNNDGVFHPTFTDPLIPGECGEPELAGGLPDESRLLLESAAALTPNAVAEQNNLYESYEGRLSLVNILPNGKIAADATFGNGQTNLISDDGSRIFWTDRNTEVTPEDPAGTTRLFVRKDGTSTVQVDAMAGGGGRFLTASSDGSKAFFTKDGDLYQYDVESDQTTDMAEDGEVQGIAGSSEDGNYVYFVAGAALAPGAIAETCKEVGARLR